MSYIMYLYQRMEASVASVEAPHENLEAPHENLEALFGNLEPPNRKHIGTFVFISSVFLLCFLGFYLDVTEKSCNFAV